MTATRERTLLAVCLIGAALAIGPAAAQASVGLQVSGSALTITGGSGADRPVLSYHAPDDEASPGYTRVSNDGGIDDPLAPTCVRSPPDLSVAPHPTLAYCEDGGSEPELQTINLTLGDGDDQPRLDACYANVKVDAGEGNNRMSAPPCSGDAFSWTSGAGSDRLAVDDESQIDVMAALGGGDDQFEGGGGPSVVRDGPGNDELVGGAGSERLLGEDGEDRLTGHEGDDELDGGAGADRLGIDAPADGEDDPGADDYRGGAGYDTLYLTNHPTGVTISLNETADDGSPGERDNVRADIEWIQGSPHADVFTGNDGPNSFAGAGGDDRLVGAGANDALDGGDGNDTLAGGPGTDSLHGDSGDDTIHGGPGRDALHGERPSCKSACVPGKDTIFGRDGEVDGIDCGGADDSAEVDAVDAASNCEVVDRAAPVPLPAGLFGKPFQKAHFSFKTRGALSVARGTRVIVTCPGLCTFTASLNLSAANARRYGLGRKTVILGRAGATQPAAGSKTVKITPSARTRRKLRRARSVPAILRVRARGPKTKLETQQLKVTLRR